MAGQVALQEFDCHPFAADRVVDQPHQQLAMVAGKPRERRDRRAQAVQWRRLPLHFDGQRGKHAVVHLLQHGAQKYVTGLEVIVKHAQVYPRMLANLADRQHARAGIRQQLERGRDQQLVNIS